MREREGERKRERERERESVCVQGSTTAWEIADESVSKSS